MNRGAVRSHVVLSVRTTAVARAHPGRLLLLLAHPGRQLASDSFALARNALFTLAGDGGGTRAAGTARVEHLRCDGPRVGPPAVLLPGLNDGVGRYRRWLVAVLSILLERGVNQTRSWLRRLMKLAPTRAVRPDARSTPVLVGEAVGAPTEVRVALGCA